MHLLLPPLTSPLFLYSLSLSISKLAKVWGARAGLRQTHLIKFEPKRTCFAVYSINFVNIFVTISIKVPVEILEPLFIRQVAAEYLWRSNVYHGKII